MSDTIRIFATFTINDGQLDTFKERAAAAAESVWANEPGMIVYEWYLAADGKTCNIIEEYANAEALTAHSAGEVGKTIIPQLMQVAALSSLQVHADPATAPEQVKQMAARMGGLHGHFAGVTRR